LLAVEPQRAALSLAIPPPQRRETQCRIPNQIAHSAAPRNQNAQPIIAAISWSRKIPDMLKQSHTQRHRLPRLVAQRDFLASHKPRDIRQSETPAHVAGFFMRDAKHEQMLAFAGTLLILNGLSGSGSYKDGPPPFRTRGQTQHYTKFPAHGSPKKFFIKKNNNMLNA